MINHSSLTPSQTAQARHHTYTLISQLYLNGITDELVPYIQALPALAAHLPDLSESDWSAYASDAAAEHYNLFGFNIFPFESVFLDETGLLEGTIPEEVNKRYQQAGFQVTQNADHIGNQLAFLAFLSGAEADAWEDQLSHVAYRIRRIQQDFLQTHLLYWLSPFVIALQYQSASFYVELANLTLDLVHNHYSDLSHDLTLASESGKKTLPAAPSLSSFLDLEDEQSKLKKIGSYFVTPPYSGIYVSRHDIALLGRQHRLPRGFGGRKQLFNNLLRVASQYDEVPTLLHAIQQLAERWLADYTTLQQTRPELTPFIALWRERTISTIDLTQQINSTD